MDVDDGERNWGRRWRFEDMKRKGKESREGGVGRDIIERSFRFIMNRMLNGAPY